MSRYWPEPSDVRRSNESAAAAGTLASPPKGWPGCFSSNAALKAFMGKKALNGKRVRLTGTPSAEDASKASAVTIEPDDPFGNAERVQAALGWAIVKGFVVYECADQAEGTSFVAHLRWWNARESGVWVDFTPRPADAQQMVLLESAHAEAKTKKEASAATAEAAAARLALGGFLTQAVRRGWRADTPAPARARPNPSSALPKANGKPAPPDAKAPKQQSAPPPPPPRLDLKGSEGVEELATPLRQRFPPAPSQ